MTVRRLSAQELARLLAAASQHDLERECTDLMLGNRAAAASLQQLSELRAKVGERFSWGYLAELLAAVDGLVSQLADWPLPLVKRNVKRMPLDDLAAAARLRCGECGPEAFVGIDDVRRRLLRLIFKQRRKSRVAPPKPGDKGGGKG